MLSSHNNNISVPVITKYITVEKQKKYRIYQSITYLLLLIVIFLTITLISVDYEHRKLHHLVNDECLICDELNMNDDVIYESSMYSNAFNAYKTIFIESSKHYYHEFENIIKLYINSLLKLSYDTNHIITTFMKQQYEIIKCWSTSQYTHYKGLLIKTCDKLNIKCNNIFQQIYEKCKQHFVQNWNKFIKIVCQKLYHTHIIIKDISNKLDVYLTQNYIQFNFVLKFLINQSYEFYNKLYVTGILLWTNCMLPIFISVIMICASGVYITLIDVIIDWLHI